MSLDLQVLILQFNYITYSEVNAMEKSIVTALMFFQVLINGLQHIVSSNVRPKLQTVDTFIKVSRENQWQLSSYGTWLLSSGTFWLPRAFAILQSSQGFSMNCSFICVHSVLILVKSWQRELLLTILVPIKQAYYLPETEYVHWARSHPVRTLQKPPSPIDPMWRYK